MSILALDHKTVSIQAFIIGILIILITLYIIVYCILMLYSNSRDTDDKININDFIKNTKVYYFFMVFIGLLLIYMLTKIYKRHDYVHNYKK